jgi:hypothetical protein
MRAARLAVLSLVGLATGAMGACSSSSSTPIADAGPINCYNPPCVPDPNTGPREAGPPEGGPGPSDGPSRDGLLPDGAPVVCQPQSGTTFTSRWHPAIHRLAACTSQQVTDYFTACYGAGATTAGCTQYTQANSTCTSCLSTPPTAVAWGAIIAYNGFSEVNVAGCFYWHGASACATQLQASTDCELAWCQANCPVTDQATLDALDACETQTANDPSQCQSYATQAQCANDAGAASSICVGTSFSDDYTRVATVLCVSG